MEGEVPGEKLNQLIFDESYSQRAPQHSNKLDSAAAFSMITPMKGLPLLKAIAALAPLATITPVHGAVLAEYLFTTPADPDTTTLNPNSSDTDINSTASAFSVSGAGETGISGSSDMAFIRGNQLTATPAGAIANGDYFTFTFTPNVGATFNLTSLEFSYGGSNNGAGSPAFTTSFLVRTDAGANADDFSTDLGASFEVSRSITADTSNNQLGPVTLNFSGSDFQNITTPVTFKIYTCSTDNSSNSRINRLDTVRLNGVPEPSVTALAVLTIGALSLRRKRR